jgi:hypothetical protein
MSERRLLRVVYDVSALTNEQIGALELEAVVQAEASDHAGGHPDVPVVESVIYAENGPADLLHIKGSSEAGWVSSWVEVNGKRLAVAPSLLIRSHSPTGFSWGYGGSGPAQLALAILLEAGLGVDADDLWPGGSAERLYQRFKEEFIVPLRDDSGPLEAFDITVDLRSWVEAQHEKERAER